MRAREIRKQARTALKGCYGEAVAVAFVPFAVMMMYKLLELATVTVLLYNSILEPKTVFTFENPLWTTIKIACSVLLFVNITPAVTGMFGWYLQLAQGRRRCGLLRTYSSLRLNIRALALYLTAWIIQLAALLPSAACFYFSYRSLIDALNTENDSIPAAAAVFLFSLGLVLLAFYAGVLLALSVAPFIFIQSPSRSAFSVIGECFAVMSGRKMRLFRLMLSMWWLRASMLLVFTIPFAVPQIMTSFGIFYSECRREYDIERNNIQG